MCTQGECWVDHDHIWTVLLTIVSIGENEMVHLFLDKVHRHERETLVQLKTPLPILEIARPFIKQKLSQEYAC